jgi:hypothetical protein
MAKSNIVPPPSLQPRKVEKKPIPQSATAAIVEMAEPVQSSTPPPHPNQSEALPANDKVDKKRFTLWLPTEVFRAFKIHTAGNDGSASAYIEELIRKDLKI